MFLLLVLALLFRLAQAQTRGSAEPSGPLASPAWEEPQQVPVSLDSPAGVHLQPAQAVEGPPAWEQLPSQRRPRLPQRLSLPPALTRTQPISLSPPRSRPVA